MTSRRGDGLRTATVTTILSALGADRGAAFGDARVGTFLEDESTIFQDTHWAEDGRTLRRRVVITVTVEEREVEGVL